MRQMLVETMKDILDDQCSVAVLESAKTDGWSAALWRTLEQSEFHLLSIPEESGGAGGDLADAAAIVHLAGSYAAPVPLAETSMLAAWALSKTGLEIPPGALTIAICDDGATLEPVPDGAFTVSGTARRVPYARMAQRIVVVNHGEQGFVAVVDPAQCRITQGVNIASEPRDDVSFERARAVAVSPSAAGIATHVRRRGALVRAIQSAGALERVLALSVQYASEREQFGRPIGRFQVIQQYLALMAAEVAAADAAVELAVERGEPDERDVAIAKIRTGQAAGSVCALAHQIHGAIGYTAEHRLHHWTTRLWAWRDEFGNEGEWSRALGNAVIARGADDLWPSLTQVRQP